MPDKVKAPAVPGINAELVAPPEEIAAFRAGWQVGYSRGWEDAILSITNAQKPTPSEILFHKIDLGKKKPS